MVRATLTAARRVDAGRHAGLTMSRKASEDFYALAPLVVFGFWQRAERF
jgi:hypothetical protein